MLIGSGFCILAFHHEPSTAILPLAVSLATRLGNGVSCTLLTRDCQGPGTTVTNEEFIGAASCEWGPFGQRSALDGFKYHNNTPFATALSTTYGSRVMAVCPASLGGINMRKGDFDMSTSVLLASFPLKNIWSLELRIRTKCSALHESGCLGQLLEHPCAHSLGVHLDCSS